MKKQRKHINLSRITAFILSVAMLAGFCPQGIQLSDLSLGHVFSLNVRASEIQTGTCGENLIWKFSNGVLTISGNGPMDNYHAMSEESYAPWESIKDKITSVIIKNGVTSIGEEAFYDYSWNCKFKEIVIPGSVKTIGNTAFGNCQALTKVTLEDGVEEIDNYAFRSSSVTEINIPSSVKRIGIAAFSGSSSLKKVTLEDGIKEIEREAFENTGLEEVKIPGSVKIINQSTFKCCFSLKKVMLEDGIEEIDNYVFDSAPLSEIEIPSSIKVIRWGVFQGCDSLTKVILKNGLKEIGGYTFARSKIKEIKIPNSVETIWEGAFCKCDDLSLIYFKGNAPNIVRVNNGNGVFEKITGKIYYPKNNETWTDTMKKEYGREANITWISYKGNQTWIDEPDTPNQPAQPDKPGTATGTRTEESDVDIEIDGGVEFTIPENVPILGGGDVSLDYGTIPVTFKREDNTYRIGIGVQDMNKKDWTTFKKFVETQKESYRKGMNSFLASKFGTASMGMSVEPEMEAYGYVEGTITKTNGVESAGGKLIVEIKGTAKQEWQTVVVVVPVVIKVKGTAGTKADFSVGFDFNKSKVYTKGEVELTLPSVRLTGGIGVSYIADISVYGEAKNLVTVESDGKDNDITASLEGALGVSAKALCFSYEKELLNGSFDYLSTKKKSKARMYARALPKVEPEAKDYEIQRVDSSSWDGSAVTEQTAKPRSIKRAASAKNTSGRVTTLLSDVYASAKPQLLQTASGKKLLIFTTDMGDRTTGNHTAVVYSIYNEQNGWSIPKMIDDDETADFDAVAAVDGENVYVTWINAKRIFTPEEAEAEDFMTKLAAETEVHAAKIALNGNTGTVTKYPAITDNAIADLHPAITVKNHVPYIAWNSNSANDILKGTGTNTVYLASLNGNAFTTKKLSEENKPVQSIAIGNLDNDVVTAYTLNSGTEENPQVQLAAVNAKGRTTIAANGQNLSPSFAKIDGSSVLLWYAQDAEGSSLNYIDTIDGEVESYIEDDAVISADYTVVDGEDSQLLICSSEKENAEETGRNLYAYVIRDGEVYEPVTLTDLEGYAAVPSGIWNGTAYEYLFTRTDVNITENTVTENTDLCITSVVPQSRLVIGDIDYTQEEVMPDADASITVPVKNNGLTNCGEGRVQIVYNGNVIGQADLEDGITSGETQNVTVDLTVPEDAAAKETLKVEAISGENTTADSTKNIQSAGSELALSVKQEDDNITAIVDNNSAFDTTAALTLKAGDASGKVLKTINLGNVESYDTVEKTFTKEELKKLGSDTVYMEVSGDAEESIKSDNTAFVYVGTEELKTLDYLTATKTKVIYAKGEKLNLDDLEVTAVYTDGSKAKVTGYTTNVKNIDMSKTGKKELEILYEEVGIGRKVVMPITVENVKTDNTKPNTGNTKANTDTNDNMKSVSSIRLFAISQKIAAGRKLTLKATVLPDNASNKKLIWKSSNPKVATVTQRGVVTVKKKTGGKKVTITATAADGSKKYASWKITSMRGIVKKVKITGSKPVKAGKKLKLKAKVTATKKANKKLLWTSSNKKYATVNAKGIVTTKKAARGKTVKITAMATDGSGKKHTVKIKIKK